MNSNEKNEYIKKNWDTQKVEDIAKAVNLDISNVRKRARKLGLPRKTSGGDTRPPMSIEEHIERDKKSKAEKLDKKHYDAKYKKAITRITELEKEREIIYETKDVFSDYVFKYKPLTNDTESVAVVLASDWHVGEEVKSAWTNGLNKYNPDIAKQCAEEFFQNTVKLLQKESQATTIDTLVLALLGDFITNYLHDENVETNVLAPADEILFAQSLLSAGIEYLLKNTKVNIIIPCHIGNHSRISDKVHFSTEGGNSLEKIMYQNLAWKFHDDPRVKFILSEAYVSYLDIGGHTIAFHHGHGMRFGGAIGGITTAVVKWVEKTERGRKADLYCFGHHHTQFDGRFFIANGSMIGYGARSLALAYGYEPRAQTFFLVNLKYKRKTVTCPILFTV